MGMPLYSVPAYWDRATTAIDDVPSTLARRWAAGEYTLERAAELLAPYKTSGTVMVSDMAGLSRMTQRLDITLLLQRLSLPKTLIHALASGLGGVAIGEWATDNSEIFFPASIPVDDVLATMMEVQYRLPDEAPEIALAIHCGAFFRIGSGLFGKEAELVQRLAEKEGRSGETLLTQAAAARLQEPDRFDIKLRAGLTDGEEVYCVMGTTRPESVGLGTSRYPSPYPPALQQALATGADGIEEIVRRYRQEQVTLLVEVCSDGTGEEPVGLLDRLLTSTLLEIEVEHALPKHERCWKSGGCVAIAALSSVDVALAVAHEVWQALCGFGLEIRVGIDAGEQLIFPAGNGRCEFVGDPVTIASKQAEDCGEPGWLYVSERAAAPAQLVGADTFQLEYSGLVLRGKRLPLGTLSQYLTRERRTYTQGVLR